MQENTSVEEIPDLYISKVILTCRVCKCETDVILPQDATPERHAKLINDVIEDGCFDCENIKENEETVRNMNGLEPLEGNVE